MRILPLMILTGVLALAGCSGEPPEASNEFNNSAEAAPNAAAAPVAAPANNAVETVAPPLDFTDEAQMRDDADASGLTARLPREGDSATTPSNATKPK